MGENIQLLGNEDLSIAVPSPYSTRAAIERVMSMPVPERATPTPTTPLYERLGDLFITDPKAYKKYMGELQKSADNGNAEAKEVMNKTIEYIVRHRKGYEGLGNAMMAVPFAGLVANPAVLGGAWAVLNNPITQALGTVSGLYNLTTGNGVQKTLNEYSNGNFWAGTKSLAGDVFDAIPLLGVIKAGKTFRNIYNLGHNAKEAATLSSMQLPVLNLFQNKGYRAGMEMFDAVPSLYRKTDLGQVLNSGKVVYSNPFIKEPQLVRIPGGSGIMREVIPGSRPITEAERLGIPRGIRNQPEPRNPINISLINRGDDALPIQNGMFTLESPEQSRKLATVHFTMNEPVSGHSGGSWDSKSTTLLLPYGNIRKVSEPINIEPMDTFFPNYNGLNFRTRGAKVFTGDRNVHKYYTENGVESVFSEEMETLLKQYKEAKKIADDYSKSVNYIPDHRSLELNRNADEIAARIQKLHSEFVDQNAQRPDLSSFRRLEGIENLSGAINEVGVTSAATPLQRILGYSYHSSPPTHSNIVDAPEWILKNENTPEGMREFAEWLLSHKSDYRKKGGKL